MNNLPNFSKKKEYTSVIPSTYIHFAFFSDSKIAKISIMLALKKQVAKGKPFIKVWLFRENIGGDGGKTLFKHASLNQRNKLLSTRDVTQ